MNFSGKYFSPTAKTSAQSDVVVIHPEINKSNQLSNPAAEVSPEETIEKSYTRRIPGNERFIQRKCAECEKEEQAQTKSTNGVQVNVSDHAAGEIQSSRGQGEYLNGKTSSFMNSRMGFDFSDVKVHTDNRATELNKELNAKAFTVGKDIYFNEGQYQPDTKNGQHLLAHELTHVVQQNGKLNPKLIQRACYEESNPSINMPACPEGSQNVGHQAQGQRNTLDANAQAIVATASGSGSNADKAIQIVKDIICTYMPSQAGKVRKISYYAAQGGLGTQSVGSGSNAQGDICVGENFLTTTTNSGISRRVLQVEHELEHIEQYRTGLAGGNNRRLREFLAFYKEALADEFIGTGRMSHGTRKALIDGALGEYNCLTDDQKTAHSTKQQELLTRRQTVNGTNGNAATNPPTACVASS